MKKLLIIFIILHSAGYVAAQNKDIQEMLFTQPFPHNLSAHAFKDKLGLFARINKESVKNVHYPSVSDTLVHIKYFGSKIHLYKASEKTLLYDFHIRNRRVRLVGDIHKGMKRHELEQLIPDLKNGEEGSLILIDPDNTVEIEFIFNIWDRVKRMNFRSEIF